MDLYTICALEVCCGLVVWVGLSGLVYGLLGHGASMMGCQLRRSGFRAGAEAHVGCGGLGRELWGAVAGMRRAEVRLSRIAGPSGFGVQLESLILAQNERWRQA